MSPTHVETYARACSNDAYYDYILIAFETLQGQRVKHSTVKKCIFFFFINQFVFNNVNNITEHNKQKYFIESKVHKILKKLLFY